jgi:hypothetical protein
MAMAWTRRLRMFEKALSARDVDPAMDFLKRGLRLEASARSTAAQLLEGPWLRYDLCSFHLPALINNRAIRICIHFDNRDMRSIDGPLPRMSLTR